MLVQRFSSIVLVDSRGWVLLQERDEFPDIDPEKWGFVGGHLDDGEDYVTCAYRELEEETGLRLDGGLQLFGTFTVFHDHTGTDDELALFVMRARALRRRHRLPRRPADRLRRPRSSYESST